MIQSIYIKKPKKHEKHEKPCYMLCLNCKENFLQTHSRIIIHRSEKENQERAEKTKRIMDKVSEAYAAYDSLKSINPDDNDSESTISSNALLNKKHSESECDITAEMEIYDTSTEYSDNDDNEKLVYQSADSDTDSLSESSFENYGATSSFAFKKNQSTTSKAMSQLQRRFKKLNQRLQRDDEGETIPLMTVTKTGKGQ